MDFLEREEAIMQNRYLILVYTLLFLVILLTGCDQGNTPETVYWQYYEACSEGRFDEAKQKLSENAIDTSQPMGVCAFTHDAINARETQMDNPLRIFSDDPKVNQQEQIASLVWLDDKGNIAAVMLVLIDKEWKINEVTWSY